MCRHNAGVHSLHKNAPALHLYAAACLRCVMEGEVAFHPLCAFYEKDPFLFALCVAC